MNNNEKELEKAGYDNWKLRSRDEEMRSRDEEMRRGAGRYGFVDHFPRPKRKKTLGICPCCDEKIEDDSMFVEEDNVLYHFSCYNYKKKEESEVDGK